MIIKVIIAGCHKATDEALIHKYLDEEFIFSGRYDNHTIEVVSGKAKGVDTFGETWARKHGLTVHGFAADWKNLGLKAGPMRNEQMAQFGTHLIAFPSKESKGTRDMIRTAQAHKLVIIKIINI